MANNDVLRRLAELQAQQGGDSESPLMMNTIGDSLGIKDSDIPDPIQNKDPINNGDFHPIDAIMSALSKSGSQNSYAQDLASLPKSPTPASLPQPYGGLTGPALDASIKANPGPVATTGFNPSAASVSQQLPSQEDGPNSTPPMDNPASKAKADLASSGTGATPSPTPQPTQTQSLPSSSYAKGLGDSDLAEAQKQANLMRLFGGLGNAADTIGSAMSRGTVKPIGIGNDLIANADEGTKNILQRRDAADKELTRNKNILELSTEKQKTDPNSDISKFGQAIATKLSATTGIPLNNISTSSWSSLKEAIPGLEKYAERLEAAKTRQQNAALAHSDKKDKDDTAAYQKAVAQAESFRGDRAAAQAQLDIYNANKAEGLANMYGDPNKLSPQLVGLLTSEVAKVAKGGVPDHQEFQMLSNPSVQSKLAGVISKFSNSPTAANAADFVKQYTDYTAVLKKEAQNVVKTKYGRVGDSLKSQKNKHYDDFKQTYLDPYLQESTTSSSGHTAKAGDVVTVKGKQYKVAADGDTLEPM